MRSTIAGTGGAMRFPMKPGAQCAVLAMVIGGLLTGSWAADTTATSPSGPDVRGKVSLDVKAADRERMMTMADQFLTEAPVTVTASHSSRSHGGRHDFFSEGDY